MNEIFSIQQVIYLERYLRDRGRWDEMKALYHPNSKVKVAWFEGSGFAFVESSKNSSTHKAALSKHRLSPSIVKVNDRKAISETDTVIELRIRTNNLEIDIFSYCRLLSQIIKKNNNWTLMSLDCIYEKDFMRTVNLNDKLEIDNDILKNFRPSYKFLSYANHLSGRQVSQELAGDDRPDLVEELYQKNYCWLYEQ